MSPQVPERASLEQLKKQAKSLLRAAQAHDAGALQRFAVLPAFATMTGAQVAAADLALHDAQSVIAREYGFASWKELREDVEMRSLSFDDAVDCSSTARRNAPQAAPSDCGHATRRSHTRRSSPNSFSAMRPPSRHGFAIGRSSRRCPAEFSSGSRSSTSVTRARTAILVLVAIARRLLEAGANPNNEYHWNWHPELPRTALWGAICAVAHLPLAEVLLEAGATPTDGVSMHISAGGGNLSALELLHRHGADVNGLPAGVPPLVYILGWSDDPSGPRWLLEHGTADELTPLERFVAACARGDRASADSMLGARPSLRADLRPEHHLLLHRAAESGNLPMVSLVDLFSDS